jgi:hypothetical protein
MSVIQWARCARAAVGTRNPKNKHMYRDTGCGEMEIGTGDWDVARGTGHGGTLRRRVICMFTGGCTSV